MQHLTMCAFRSQVSAQEKQFCNLFSLIPDSTKNDCAAPSGQRSRFHFHRSAKVAVTVKPALLSPPVTMSFPQRSQAWAVMA